MKIAIILSALVLTIFSSVKALNGAITTGENVSYILLIAFAAFMACLGSESIGL